MFRITTAILTCLALPALADENIADQYPDSALYEKPVEVIPDVWSAIGATAPPTYENVGHNNNLSFIVTGDGVIVVNAGANYKLAEALHTEIKAITDQPRKTCDQRERSGPRDAGQQLLDQSGRRGSGPCGCRP